MQTKKTLLLSLLTAALFTSCHNGQKPPVEQRVTEYTDSLTGIISLRDYTINDTITIAGKPYSYTCTLEHMDSMPVLINPQGLEYHESRVRVHVQNGNTEVFSKTFYKSNFHDFVPANVLKTSTMVGVNYNFTKRDEDRSALYFIVTVGDPDETSDIAYPFELKVAPDGSYSIRKAENLETEPLTPGLNIDPSEDAV